MEKLSLDEAIVEWKSKDRSKIGCVQAANWFCRRVGHILIDPSPWNDAPEPGPLFGWEKFEGKS